MRRLGGDRGQTLVLTVLSLGVLLGMATLVVDVGVWFRADRRLQATVDAAALAGAQALPEDPAAAVGLALDYAGRNGGGVEAGEVSVSTTVRPNDTITIEAEAGAPTIFGRIFSLFSVEVHARAQARTAAASRARRAAPIAVSELHPLLQCTPLPCFEQSTELQLANLKQGAGAGAGAFGIINLDSSIANPGASTVADWIRTGFGGYLGLSSYGEVYESVPGATFNSSSVRDALAARVGTELLFPVYRSITGSGSNATFDVIGWVAFELESFSGSGSSGTLRGKFKRVTWDGLEEGPAAADFGVRTVALVG